MLPGEVLDKRPFPVEEAEALVKQWQAIKAEALGPDHQLQSLSEVLSESMLTQVIVHNNLMISLALIFD
ncbi:hypothetical protein GIB67_003490 [Kingdonia uniflora]|uniref:Plastid division protein CDP1-like IMS domain-containing protein n=1 Tax=Kingdonia uniflora TaxID=39325 RepID=A0A7J7MER3_9MAGN|nr:hypothetical protein GIB67_003490 [Kingdonia uniflora]